MSAYPAGTPYPIDLSTDAVDPMDDVDDKGDHVRVYVYSGPDALLAAISTGKPVRLLARDGLRLTADDIRRAEQTASSVGWVTEAVLDRPWAHVLPPDLAEEWL